MSEKKKKKWWQNIFRNYREVIIFTLGVGAGVFVAIYLLPVLMLAIGLIIGYSYHKFLILRKKGQDDKKEKGLN